MHLFLYDILICLELVGSMTPSPPAAGLRFIAHLLLPLQAPEPWRTESYRAAHNPRRVRTRKFVGFQFEQLHAELEVKAYLYQTCTQIGLTWFKMFKLLANWDINFELCFLALGLRPRLGPSPDSGTGPRFQVAVLHLAWLCSKLDMFEGSNLWLKGFF